MQALKRFLKESNPIVPIALLPIQMKFFGLNTERQAVFLPKYPKTVCQASYISCSIKLEKLRSLTKAS